MRIHCSIDDIERIRAPNGMGWDEKNGPWDLQADPIPSHGISKKHSASHPIPWDLQIIASHPIGSHGAIRVIKGFF
jgi:hypothetical protein